MIDPPLPASDQSTHAPNPSCFPRHAREGGHRRLSIKIWHPASPIYPPGYRNSLIATLPVILLIASNTVAFFAERSATADFAAFDRIMNRKGGEKPRPEDTLE